MKQLMMVKVCSYCVPLVLGSIYSSPLSIWIRSASNGRKGALRNEAGVCVCVCVCVCVVLCCVVSHKVSCVMWKQVVVLWTMVVCTPILITGSVPLFLGMVYCYTLKVPCIPLV